MIKTYVHGLEESIKGVRDKDVNNFLIDNKSFATQTNTIENSDGEQLIVTTIFYEGKSK